MKLKLRKSAMKYYRYKTKVGILYIRQSKNDPKIFQLWIDDEVLGKYSSPQLAAVDVFMQVTGYY